MKTTRRQTINGTTFIPKGSGYITEDGRYVVRTLETFSRRTVYRVIGDGARSHELETLADAADWIRGQGQKIDVARLVTFLQDV